MQLIAHRGFWWPRRDAQNHPSSVLNAFANGYGCEVDIWGVHGNSIQIGHDHPQYEWTISSDVSLWKEQPLFLHMKMAREKNLWKIERMCEILQNANRLEHTFLFQSPDHTGPDKEIASCGIKQLLPIDSLEALQTALKNPDSLDLVTGFWLEQPELDWVDKVSIDAVHAIGKFCYVVAPELHERMVDLTCIETWRSANGIVTDYPHLLAILLNEDRQIVYPKEVWW